MALLYTVSIHSSILLAIFARSAHFCPSLAAEEDGCGVSLVQQRVVPRRKSISRSLPNLLGEVEDNIRDMQKQPHDWFFSGSPLGQDVNLLSALIAGQTRWRFPVKGCCQHFDFDVCQHGSDFTSPMQDVVRHLGTHAMLVDGFCHFGWDILSTRARRQRNYLEFVVPTAARSGAAFGAPPQASYRDPSGWETLPGVYAADVKYCMDSGAMNVSNGEVLLRNFSAMEAAAARLCSGLGHRLGMITMEEHSDRWTAEVRSFQLEYKKPLAERSQSLFSRETHLLLAAGKCDLGDFGPDLAYCIYNFCKLPGNKVGMGKQCRNNWLTEELPPLSVVES